MSSSQFSHGGMIVIHAALLRDCLRFQSMPLIVSPGSSSWRSRDHARDVQKRERGVEIRTLFPNGRSNSERWFRISIARAQIDGRIRSDSETHFARRRSAARFMTPSVWIWSNHRIHFSGIDEYSSVTEFSKSRGFRPYRLPSSASSPRFGRGEPRRVSFS